MTLSLALVVTVSAALSAPAPAPPASPRNERSTAETAAAAYSGAVIRTLADLVAFPTVRQEGSPNQDQASFKAMTVYLKAKAAELGMDFTDAGAVVVVGMGTGDRRLGLVTHGDVQPADASKWARGPFALDAETKPGLLIGRGAEDDKGPIAAALYAMKAVKDSGRPLSRRVELIVSYTEESDWEPFQDYLAKNPPPDLNVVLDAVYPVVVAEKGWVGFHLRVGGQRAAGGPAVVRFEGGAFLSQVPEDARAEIQGADAALLARLEAAATADKAVRYSFDKGPETLTVRARGVSAHSGKPDEGVNAITHLADVLSAVSWAKTPAGNAVRLVHDLVGTGFEAERFGRIAYADAFMGPLTLSLGTARQEAGAAGDHEVVDLGINLRRPVGKDAATLEREIRDAVRGWQESAGVAVEIAKLEIYDPYDARNAPQVPVLLDIFRSFTGQSGATAVSMGGGTHARLVPNGVSFGPVLPGKPYTGHAENEYIEREDLLLSLRIYTEMIERLAGR